MPEVISPTWTRLIRFIAVEDNKTYYGEPIERDLDIGLATYHSEEASNTSTLIEHITCKPTQPEPDLDSRFRSEHVVRARVWEMETPWAGDAQFTGKVMGVKKLLTPVPVQGPIRAVGLNYKDHAAEMNLPLPSVPSTFLKPPHSAANPNTTIPIPTCAQNDEMDYEVELAVVLSRNIKDVSEDEASGAVLGYMVGNDLTARKVQEMTSQWGNSKSYDKFLPLGPVLLSPRALPDPSVLRLKTYLNGKVMQDGFASSIIFGVPKIISFLSRGTTLPAGTVIITGTPSGIGHSQTPKVWLNDGDVVRCWISHGIGSLINRIEYEGGTTAPQGRDHGRGRDESGGQAQGREDGGELGFGGRGVGDERIGSEDIESGSK